MPSTMTCKSCGARLDLSTGGVCAACFFGDVLSETTDGPVPGYALGAELGRGGSAVVYRAHQPSADREVAVKVLKVSWVDGQGLRERFRLEAQTLARLEHAGILPLYDFGEADGVPWYSMMLARGGTLAERMERYRGRWKDIARLMQGVAEAVWYAHERGVLHRDLKPGNLLFGEDDRVYVADFGLARILATPSDVTVTAAVLGTPAYLAPEIVSEGAAAATTASDVWGLGVVLYELLAQKRPFSGESVPDLVAQITSETPRVPDGPKDLAAIAMKALRREPSRRYASVLEFARDLEAWSEGRQVQARPYSLAERLVIYVKRRPAVSTLAAFTCLGVAGIAWAGLREAALRQQAEVARERAETAEKETRTQLRSALLAEATTLTKSGALGQKFHALESLKRAAALAPGRDLRDVAVVALSKPDFNVRMGPGLADWDLSSLLVFDVDRRHAWYRNGEAMVLRAVDDGKVLRTFPLEKGLEIRLNQEVSPDGNHGMCTTADDVLHVWNFASGKEVLRLEKFTAVENAGAPYLRDATFSPVGGKFAAGDQKGGLAVYDLATGAEIARRTSVCERPINRIVYEADGNRLWVSAVREKKARLLVLNATTLETEREYVLPRAGVVQTFAVDRPHGRLLVGESEGYALYSLDKGEVLYSVSGFDYPVKFAWFRPDGKYVELWQNGTVLETRDVETGRLVLSVPSKGLGPPSKDSSGTRWLYASLSLKDRLRELEFKEGDLSARGGLAAELSGTAPGNSLAFSADGKWLVASGSNGLAIFDVESGSKLTSVYKGGTSGDKWASAFAPDGSSLVVSSHVDGLSRYPLLPQKDGGLALGPRETISPDPGFMLLALSPDGKRVILAHDEEGAWVSPGVLPAVPVDQVRCVDLSSGRVVWTNPVLKPWSACYSSDGSKLYVSRNLDTEPSNHILNPNTGEVVFSATGPSICCLFEPTDSWSYGTTDRGKVGRQNWATGEFKQDLPSEIDVNYFVYAPSVRRQAVFAAGFNDLCLFSMKDGIRVTLPNPYSQTSVLTTCLALNRAETRLATFDAMGRVTLWKLDVLDARLRELGLGID